MNEKTKSKIDFRLVVATGIAVAVGVVFGSSVVKILFQSFGDDQVSISQVLTKTADEVNRNLPMMVDQNTRLDSTAALPGNKLIYKYTLIDLPVHVDEAILIAKLRPKLINNYKTSSEMSDLRNMGVVLVYSYYDEEGNQFANFSISTSDF